MRTLHGLKAEAWTTKQGAGNVTPLEGCLSSMHRVLNLVPSVSQLGMVAHA